MSKSPQSGQSRPLGAHVLPRLWGLAHRTVRLRHQAAAYRSGRTLSLLQPEDSRHLVVAFLLLLAQVQQPAATFDSSTFDPLVRAGIVGGVYPGAAVVVGRRDTILFAKGYGHLTWSAGSPLVRVDSTLWDVASLTKVVATPPDLMLLVERGLVARATRVGDHAGSHAAGRARPRRARYAGGALRAGVQRTRHRGDHRPPPADAYVRFTSDAAAARSRRQRRGAAHGPHDDAGLAARESHGVLRSQRDSARRDRATGDGSAARCLRHARAVRAARSRARNAVPAFEAIGAANGADGVVARSSDRRGRE